MFLVEAFSLLPKIPAGAFSFLPVDYREDVARDFHGGLEMVASTLLLTFFLELCSIPTVKGVLQQPGGKSLYLSAIGLNFFNNLFLGIPLWMTLHVYFRHLCSYDRGSCVYDHVIDDYAASSLRVLAVLLIHSFCYYHVHKFFHTNRAWYKYHAYHHRFNKHVPPVASGAVHTVEYLFGYILPFVLSVFMVLPLLPEIKMALYIIGDLNVLCHFPLLGKLSEKLCRAFVSPALHMEHHQKQNCNLAAPTFNVDWFYENMENLFVKFKSNEAKVAASH